MLTEPEMVVKAGSFFWEKDVDQMDIHIWLSERDMDNFQACTAIGMICIPCDLLRRTSSS